ncbi:hypothetical protein [Chloroherpeton thalassium]|uniref:hypothetical protein n=1 Tax=Chloroherpeton thalassium TaxID=100716 RepID=UPI0012F9B7B3|nr:hypothetical protein [Chloroherpeton thalassium]
MKKKKQAPVSPWDWQVELRSPNQKHLAKIAQGCEIAMGAPSMGVLHLNGKPIEPYANASIVWSDDSTLLAVPVWTNGWKQVVKVFTIDGQCIFQSKQRYRVLELHDFENGIIKGIDSPIYQPKKMELFVATERL